MSTPRAHSRAFSLLELVVVIVVIGVIAAIAGPRLSRAAATAKESACAATLRGYVQAIEQFQGTEGRWPTGITPSLLGLRTLPPNPYGGSGVNPVQRDTSGDESLLHPALKTFRTNDPSAKTWWYNPANGEFRALVPQTSNSAEDMALYVRLNGPVAPGDIEPDALLGGTAIEIK